jgi:hypothetical protein
MKKKTRKRTGSNNNNLDYFLILCVILKRTGSNNNNLDYFLILCRLFNMMHKYSYTQLSKRQQKTENPSTPRFDVI